MIGFIGLGNMGAHMARNLMKNGHKLVVFDVSANATNALKVNPNCEFQSIWFLFKILIEFLRLMVHQWLEVLLKLPKTVKNWSRCSRQVLMSKKFMLVRKEF